MRVAGERKQNTVKGSEGGGSARRFVLGEVLPAVSVRQLEPRQHGWRDYPGPMENLASTVGETPIEPLPLARLTCVVLAREDHLCNFFLFFYQISIWKGYFWKRQIRSPARMKNGPLRPTYSLRPNPVPCYQGSVGPIPRYSHQQNRTFFFLLFSRRAKPRS
jgi:hypothetical protein